MSQFAHPAVTTRVPRSTRTTLIAALLALAAVAAIALVIALGNDTSNNDQVAVADQAQPSLRADSGPEESAVAASLGSSTIAGPDESAVAASVAAGISEPTTAQPDESHIAALGRRRLHPADRAGPTRATSPPSPSPPAATRTRREHHRRSHLRPLDRPGPRPEQPARGGQPAPAGTSAFRRATARFNPPLRTPATRMKLGMTLRPESATAPSP